MIKVDPDKTDFAQNASEATLLIENGPQANARYPLSNKPIIIGRDLNADISLSDDSECSRQHAQVFWLSQQFAIEDLNSTNGTFVNDIRISSVTLLSSNDKISIGKTNLYFQIVKISTTAPVEQITDTPKLSVDFDPEAVLVADPNLVPSRSVLTAASEMNRRLGHENLGFLSEEHGFMPTTAPMLALPPMYSAWDEIAERMPELYRTLSLRSTFDSLPVL